MFPFNGSKTPDFIIFVATGFILKLKLELRKLPQQLLRINKGQKDERGLFYVHSTLHL